MESNAKTYVEQHDGGYWIAGTRISLDSIVYAYRDGFLPRELSENAFHHSVLSKSTERSHIILQTRATLIHT